MIVYKQISWQMPNCRPPKNYGRNLTAKLNIFPQISTIPSKNLTNPPPPLAPPSLSHPFRHCAPRFNAGSPLPAIPLNLSRYKSTYLDFNRLSKKIHFIYKKFAIHK